jgi:hypothetical protein
VDHAAEAVMRFLAASAVVLAAHAAHADPAVPADLATYGDDGLRIGDQVLFQGPVGGAALDPAQDLIWFTSGGTVQVIDLRDATRAPVVILDHMEGAAFRVSGFSSVDVHTAPSSTFLSLTLGKKPKVRGETGLYAEVDPAAAKAQLKALEKTTIVGAAWIKSSGASRARSPRPPSAPPRPPSSCRRARGIARAPGAAATLRGSPARRISSSSTRSRATARATRAACSTIPRRSCGRGSATP